MGQLPLWVDLTDSPVLVVGAGRAAAVKIPPLLSAGARVRVVAPAASEAVRALAFGGRLTWESRPFSAGDVAGMRLVVAAVGDLAVHRAVWDAARQAGAWVIDAAWPEQGQATFGAVVRRDPLVLGIATGGVAPRVAARIRAELEAAYGPEWSAYCRLMGEVRAWARAKLPPERRRRAWERLEALPLLEWIRRGERSRATEAAWAVLKEEVDGHER